MNVAQCDNCKALGPTVPSGWIIAVVIEQPQPSFLSFMGGGNGGADPAGMFCTWKCVAEYAMVRALVPGGEVTG